MHWNLEAVIAVVSMAPMSGLWAQADPLGRVEPDSAAYSPAWAPTWPADDMAPAAGATAFTFTVLALPDSARLEDLNRLEDKEGAFAEIEAVDPEYLPLPEAARPFTETPHRAGAPPYSALYFGFRIALPRRTP